jgi:hypothetical protein
MRPILFVLLFSIACSPPPENASTPPATMTELPVVSETASTTTPAPPATETGLKLRPADEASQDPSFLAFRERLLDAVKRKDRDFLLSVLLPTIRVSFGDVNGVEGFKKHWKLDSPDSPVWDQLDKLLRMGGTFDTLSGERRFCAPYVYSAYPHNGPDAFESLVVTAENVPLHEKADSSSPAVATLSYDIVRIADNYKHPANWRKVKTESGKTGWVEERFVRSQIDYRACFEKKAGDWKMVLLVAGD